MSLKLEELTALYSPLDIEYNNVMSGPYTTLTFHNFDNCDGSCIAALKDGRISGFWRPMVCIGSEKYQKFQIENLWKVSNDIYYMDFLIDNRISPITKFLLEKGYKAKPYYTQIIDTSKESHILHSQIRESYKSLVNKYKNVEYGNISNYRKLHNLTTKDRCEESWKIQQKMIDAKEAYCMVDGENLEAAIVVYYNQYSAYYAGGKSVPGFNSHALIWQAIIRNKGKMFEMGEQVFCDSQLVQTLPTAHPEMKIWKDEKQHKLFSISKFKRGFDGETKTRLILEKEK